mgnify:CR=1 FL=1
MGGRGTYAIGNNVKYQYKTVEKIEGVKVLQRVNESASGGLPEEAHSSKAYILLNKNGVFKMYREYDENHYLRLEIAYHPEKSVDPSRKPVLHVHEYRPDNFSDRKPRQLTTSEFEKYKKYFRGVIV